MPFEKDSVEYFPEYLEPFQLIHLSFQNKHWLHQLFFYQFHLTQNQSLIVCVKSKVKVKIWV